MSKQRDLIVTDWYSDLCSTASLMKYRYSLCCHHVLRLVQDGISGQDRPMFLAIVTALKKSHPPTHTLCNDVSQENRDEKKLSILPTVTKFQSTQCPSHHPTLPFQHFILQTERQSLSHILKLFLCIRTAKAD